MFDLHNAETEYADQTFEGLVLSEDEIVSKSFYDCSFVGCSFSGTCFRECKFYSCIFRKCDIRLVRLPGCSFSDTGFEDSSVIGVNWTEAAWPRRGFMCPISFTRCAISHSTFIGLALKEIVIRECIARDVDFREADLTKADLTHTDLADSLFTDTDLTEADLTQAKNYTINPSLNVLKRTKFSLPEAMSLLYGLDIILEE
jgi:fluoroquinolone resistance protein